MNCLFAFFQKGYSYNIYYYITGQIIILILILYNVFELKSLLTLTRKNIIGNGQFEMRVRPAMIRQLYKMHGSSVQQVSSISCLVIFPPLTYRVIRLLKIILHYKLIYLENKNKIRMIYQSSRNNNPFNLFKLIRYTLLLRIPQNIGKATEAVPGAPLKGKIKLLFRPIKL